MADYVEVWGAKGAEIVALAGDQVTIGRAASNDVSLVDTTVSKLHAVVQRYPTGWSVRDVGSSNGTFVNGDRLAGERFLRTGDEIRIGMSRLVFRGEPGVEEGATVGAEAPPSVTPRERDLLVALCRPLAGSDAFAHPPNTRALANELVVSEAAVKFHLTNLYDKFGLHDTSKSRRIQLANEAIRRRAVTLAELREVDD